MDPVDSQKDQDNKYMNVSSNDKKPNNILKRLELQPKVPQPELLPIFDVFGLFGKNQTKPM